MTRKEFIKMCGILGVGLPLQTSLLSCSEDDNGDISFTGKVIIIGAGAGGLSAGYLLQQKGIDVELLEASSVYGGRMKINTTFADFPIPLGAEWLETDTNIFERIVNDSSISVNVDTTPDDPDRKFVNYSWFNFFEEYIVPSVSDKIIYNSIVQAVDYSGNQVMITTQNGQHVADKVIISVPLKILQDNDINFAPIFPQSKLNAINGTTVWEGFKAFFEFSQNFYTDGFEFSISPASDGQKIYYNAAHGQNTAKNILGLFIVGKPARDYISLPENELKNFILNELDGLYDNQATPNYINHITQNWQQEPFVKAGYMSDYANENTVRELGRPIADKLYFAGGAYTDGNDWVSVHAAAQSAIRSVDELVK